MLDIESKITDVLLERPIGFTINGERFCVCPRTIGNSRLISGVLDNIEFNKQALSSVTSMEIVRVCRDYRQEVLRIIAYATLRGKECLNENKVLERISTYDKKLDTDDIATLLHVIFTPEHSKELKEQLGIDKELKEYNRIAQAKGNKGSYTFCGKSIYGVMISTLAEKYGWTLDYIVWGISLANINMLLADSVKTIYLTEEEIKKIHPKQSSDTIKADDPKNKELILSMNWD